MLLMFFSALVICIALTVAAFSLFGKNVYAKKVSNEMGYQAERIAGEITKLVSGETVEENYLPMLTTVEARVIALDNNKSPILIYKGRKPETQGRPNEPPPDSEPHGDGEGMKNEEYITLCRSLFDDACAAEASGGFSMISKTHGVIVAAPILDPEGSRIGQVFLIRPMTDVSSTSRSLVIVLIFSAAAAGLLMIVPLFFMAKWLTSPVKELTDAAELLSAGDYSLRVDPRGSHEVRELGSAVNTLAANLQSNIGDLTLERNRLSAILDGLGEGIIGFDKSLNVTKYNASALKLLGGGEDINRIPELEKVRETAEKAMNTGENAAAVIKCRERMVRISAAGIDESTGRVAGAVALLMDVTEAERLEQTRRDYVANVSHELRTPLASIRGIADMLNDGLVKNESDKIRYYGYILKESIRLSTLINDLLELSRLQSGAVEPRMQRMELYELIADVADRMTEPANAAGMTVLLNVPEGRYFAHSNPDRVEQVLITLMDNAVKHGAEGGTIEIGLGEDGGEWLIGVKNPAEIGQNDIEHLFERFYKADIAHTSEGTGLGLAIAEEVLSLLGERISVSYEDGMIEFVFTVKKDVKK